MPLKLNVGLSRKMGEANYGSRGASVNLEVELDSTLAADSARLQDRIHQLFGLVRVSLDQELHGKAPHNTASPETLPASGNGNGNGSHRRTNGREQRPATVAQGKALVAIARSQRLDLANFLHARFSVARPDELTIGQASEAIDELKQNLTPSRR